jgi:hypothetical protein
LTELGQNHVLNPEIRQDYCINKTSKQSKICKVDFIHTE